MRNFIVVGLTGQTGAGKSTVSAVFREKGFCVINADIIARQVVERGKPCLAEIVQAFGEEITDNAGNLNRKKLAGIVFTDRKSLEKLDNITYPYIVKKISDTINNLISQDNKFIILDAPTLFESSADKLCNVIVSVLAKPEIRLERIITRDNLTPEQAQNRMNSQHKDEFFIENSDYIIENNGTPEETGVKTAEIAGKIRRLLSE